MYAALKILFDVAFFRLRRLEMANLAAAGSIMLALRMDFLDAGVRLAFGGLLNVLAYLTNDYFDVDQDLASPNKDHAKVAFLKAHMRAALWAQIVLAAILAAAGLAWSPGLVVALVTGAGICWLYSWKLKHAPYLDVLAMIVWGLTMPLVGFPLDSVLGWCLIGQLGLSSAVFESIQVIRDYDEDARSGVRTTAVRLGERGTLLLIRALMVTGAVYATCLLSRWLGPLLLAALFIRLKTGRADRYWNQVRLMLGLGWLAIVGRIFWTGSSDGLLFSAGPGRTIPFLAFLN
ncbi:MAG: UbiA family prenyltransferase [Deltaproteobacteria bacterium]|nr:UbiA family prenyltransferase [Deltaproteobacteria bacterium]